MDWRILLTAEIRNFIHENEDKDVSALGLKKPPAPDWPYPLILNQIKARQKARKKIPLWLSGQEDIVLPLPDLLEQASSAATARYKARLVTGKSFIDLCAGVGVDSWAFSEHFEHGILVEKSSENAALLAHNIPLLTSADITVHEGAAEDLLEDLPTVDLIYIDPQRRDGRQKGKFRFEDCAPDILGLLPRLKDKAKHAIIKASPMIDIDYGIEALKHVHSVHVVEFQGECKEVLFVLHLDEPAPPLGSVPIQAVRLHDEGDALHEMRFTRAEENAFRPSFTMPQAYLYEPSPAFLKSGGFNTIAERYDLDKLHAHTHLYTAERLVQDFPGRSFAVEAMHSAHEKALPFDKANLALRNFPGHINDLRKRLKLKDGGDTYIFACTFVDETKGLIQTRKV